MAAVLLLILMVIIAFIAGLLIWKLCGGKEDTFDQKAYSEIMDARLKKTDLETAMSLKIKSMGPKTRKALEEDMGTNEFRFYLRG